MLEWLLTPDMRVIDDMHGADAYSERHKQSLYMPTVIDTQAIAEQLHQQYDTCDMPPPTPLSTRRRRYATLLTTLAATIAARFKHRLPYNPRLIPDSQRQESYIDILAQKHTDLYIRSFSS